MVLLTSRSAGSATARPVGSGADWEEGGVVAGGRMLDNGGEAKAVVEFGSMSVAQDDDESSEEEEEDDDDYDDDFDEDEEEAAAPSAARAADSGRRQPMKGYDSDDGVIETEFDD